MWLKFDSEYHFCQWYAALKLGCKGKTMAASTYKMEIDRNVHKIESVKYINKIKIKAKSR